LGKGFGGREFLWPAGIGMVLDGEGRKEEEKEEED